MSLILHCLPVELQEKILSMLPWKSLYSASKVCRLWFQIAARLAVKRADPHTLPETLLEVQQDILCCSEHLWMRLMNCHSLQLQMKENLFRVVGPSPLQSSQERIGHCSTAVLGCIFYASCNQDVEVFDARSNFKYLMTLACKNGPVKQIVPVPKLKKILVLSKTLEVYDEPKWDGNKYDMKKVQVIPHNRHNELYRFKAISVDDVFLAVQKDEFSITVFYMDHETNDEYFLRFINRTKTTHKIYQFCLWKEEIIILLEIGEILWWSISASNILHCGSFQEIRYRNPVWLVKGRMFCSTITSRVLLGMGLWHLEAGSSYWLIGKPTKNLARCYNFDPVLDGTNCEIRCICLKFRLLICGTNNGHVLINYLSDAYFNNENIRTNTELDSEFHKRPDVVVKLVNEAIEDIVADFSNESLYLMLQTRSSSNVNITCVRFYMGKVEMSTPMETEEASASAP